MTKSVVLALAATLACMTGAAASSAAADVEIVTEYNQSYVHTARKAGSENGIDGLTQRDQGISWRPRLALPLSERRGRKLNLMLGGYLRRPVIYALSGAGAGISGVQATELGVEAGFSWFGFARTFLQVSPGWTLSYEAAGVIDDDPSLRTKLQVVHQSLGVRLEIPLPFLTLDSEPGDRRVEFGLAAAFMSDSVKHFVLTPANFAAGDVPDTSFDTEIEDTQESSKRWTAGIFVNVRI